MLCHKAYRPFTALLARLPSEASVHGKERRIEKKGENFIAQKKQGGKKVARDHKWWDKKKRRIIRCGQKNRM
jgi:hypothetical protein